MKATLYLAGMIMIMLGQFACQMKKLTSRQVEKLEVREQIDTQINMEKERVYRHSRVMRDSLGHEFQLTIFPVDTIQFSLENGFVGRAWKLELKGNSSQLRSMADSRAFNESVNSLIQTRENRKVEAKVVDRLKNLEKVEFSWWKVCAIGVLMVTILVLVWKFRR